MPSLQAEAEMVVAAIAPNSVIIYPPKLRHVSSATLQAILLQLYREEARTSRATRWYLDATSYEPLALLNNK